MITSRRPPPDPVDACEALRAVIEDAGSAAAAARRLGCSTSYVLDVRHGRRPPSDRLLGALGLEWRVVASEGTLPSASAQERVR